MLSEYLAWFHQLWLGPVPSEMQELEEKSLMRMVLAVLAVAVAGPFSSRKPGCVQLGPVWLGMPAVVAAVAADAVPGGIDDGAVVVVAALPLV